LVTEIGQSRVALRVSGAGAPVTFNRGLPVGLDDDAFPPDSFAQCVVHRIPIRVHRVHAESERVFDVYVTGDYAAAYWEWLIGAAEPFGELVEGAG
jgi:heterotetrameric sarcosine oxidase gamma subunit